LSFEVNSSLRPHAKIGSQCGGRSSRPEPRAESIGHGIRAGERAARGLLHHRADHVPRPDLEPDLAATRRNVRFLLEGGIDACYGTLLAGGAAGDFPP
jgi:hypothetical protein